MKQINQPLKQRARLSGSCLYSRRPDGDSLVERSLLWFPEFLYPATVLNLPLHFFHFQKEVLLGPVRLPTPTT